MQKREQVAKKNWDKKWVSWEILHAAWLADRPTMADNNNELPSIIFAYLHQEISELNGHAEDGMSLEEYRVQEIADVAWFAYSLSNSLQDSTGNILDGNAIYQEIKKLKKPSVVRDVKSQWTSDNEHEYKLIKSDLLNVVENLNQVMRPLKNLTSDEYSRESVEKIKLYSVKIIAYASILTEYISGETILVAMLEKGARNVLKHATQFYDPEHKNYRNSQDYAAARKAASGYWAEVGGNSWFYQTDPNAKGPVPDFGQYNVIEEQILQGSNESSTALVDLR